MRVSHRRVSHRRVSRRRVPLGRVFHQRVPHKREFIPRETIPWCTSVGDCPEVHSRREFSGTASDTAWLKKPSWFQNKVVAMMDNKATQASRRTHDQT